MLVVTGLLFVLLIAVCFEAADDGFYEVVEFTIYVCWSFSGICC